MLRKVTYCAGHISATTRPHQLHWDDTCIDFYPYIIIETLSADYTTELAWRYIVLCSGLTVARNILQASIVHVGVW